jgi:hypothetical protein
MAVMPVMVVPVMVPMAMPVMVPAAMMVPAHFLRLDVVDVVLRYDSGFSTGSRGSCLQCCRYRRQRRGLCTCGKHHTTRHKSHREF